MAVTIDGISGTKSNRLVLEDTLLRAVPVAGVVVVFCNGCAVGGGCIVMAVDDDEEDDDEACAGATPATTLKSALAC